MQQGRDEVYSEKIRAGKRTYFFDVRSTRSNDYYITITESKRKFNGRGYDKHKIFLYKEDFNKFLASLEKTIGYVKTELLPDYDYEEFDRKPIENSFSDSESTETTSDDNEEDSNAPAADDEQEESLDTTDSEEEGDELNISWDEDE